MTVHAWQIERLDVDAYLARIGLSVQPPSRSALDRLLEAHVRTFTFDNIDVLLEQHPGVGLDAVQSKFVGRGRGGYCFDHATLFAAALERLGDTVERRLGRVGDTNRTAHGADWGACPRGTASSATSMLWVMPPRAGSSTKTI